MKVLSLTNEQKQAVEHTGPRILLLAPAGSGKTEVLIRRIERLLAESIGDSFRVLAVTYTVKAAEELKARIGSSISEEAWRVDCDTLHGFALDWLMRYGKSVGVGPGVIIYSDDVDRMALLSEYIRSLGLERHLGPDTRKSLRPILEAIDASRTLGSEGEFPTEFFGIPLAELSDAYGSALSRAGGIDFPGMLTKFAELLDGDPWVAGNFRGLYRHVLIDEGQDLTPVQTQVLLRLSTDPVSLFLVADDRQSINEFAGGSFQNARRLAGDSALVLHLRHNFRCSQRVLDAAERLASHLKTRPSVSLTAPGAPPGELIVLEAETPEGEAKALSTWISDLVRDGLPREALSPDEDPRVSPEDVAVIARARWLLDAAIKSLNDAGHRLSLNLEVSGFLLSVEGRLLFEALAILADRADRPAQRRFVDELSLYPNASFTDDPLGALKDTGAPILVAVAQHLAPLIEEQASLATVLGQLGKAFGDTPLAADAQMLERYWLEYRANTSTQQRTLKGFLRFVSRAQLAKPSDAGVRVLTIHRVKGLEFKAVALVGVYEGALPDYRARTSAELDSERRSIYVAMTRAQRALRISWPVQTMDRYERTHLQTPSRFLREAGLVD